MHLYLHCRNNATTFNIATANVELMHERFPKHSCMGTAKMKYDKETERKGKKGETSMESSDGARKNNEAPTASRAYPSHRSLRSEAMDKLPTIIINEYGKISSEIVKVQ